MSDDKGEGASKVRKASVRRTKERTCLGPERGVLPFFFHLLWVKLNQQTANQQSTRIVP